MADEILKLANFALAVLGVNRMDAIDESTSSSQLFNDVWDITRQEFLGSHTWRGATQTFTLVENTDVAKPGRWAKAFDLPSSVLQVWKCNDTPETEEQPLWEPGVALDGSTLVAVVFTDKGSVEAKCSVDLTTDAELAVLKPKVYKALGYAVAAAMAPGWGMSGNDLVFIETLAEKHEGKAIAVNDQSGKLKKNRYKPLVAARFETGTRGRYS